STFLNPAMAWRASARSCDTNFSRRSRSNKARFVSGSPRWRAETTCEAISSAAWIALQRMLDKARLAHVVGHALRPCKLAELANTGFHERKFLVDQRGIHHAVR